MPPLIRFCAPVRSLSTASSDLRVGVRRLTTGAPVIWSITVICLLLCARGVKVRPSLPTSRWSKEGRPPGSGAAETGGVVLNPVASATRATPAAAAPVRSPLRARGVDEAMEDPPENRIFRRICAPGEAPEGTYDMSPMSERVCPVCPGSRCHFETQWSRGAVGPYAPHQSPARSPAQHQERAVGTGGSTRGNIAAWTPSPTRRLPSTSPTSATHRAAPSGPPWRRSWRDMQERQST